MSLNGKVNICDNKVMLYVLSALAIFLWGMSYIWSDSLISQEIPIFFFVPLRIFIAGILLLLFNALTKQFRTIAKKDLWKFAILALFEPLIYFLCETQGIKETGSPTISAMVIASVPIVSVGAGFVFFKERISFLNALGIFTTLVGLFIVLMLKKEVCDPKHLALGIVLLLVAVVAEVGHATMTKFLSSDYRPQVIAMYQFLIGSIYLMPFFLFKGIENVTPIYFSWEVIKPILCLAVLCSSLAFSLWAMAIKRLGVAKSSVFLATMCIATALVSEVIGREHLVFLQWLGVFVAVFGIVLSQTNLKKN